MAPWLSLLTSLLPLLQGLKKASIKDFGSCDEAHSLRTGPCGGRHLFSETKNIETPNSVSTQSTKAGDDNSVLDYEALPRFKSKDEVIRMKGEILKPSANGVIDISQVNADSFRYSLIEFLGKGTEGEVWKALEQGTGINVAIKFLMETLEEKLNEIEILAVIGRGSSTYLNVPHHVIAYDNGVVIVSELVSGGPISSYRFSEESALIVAQQILQARADVDDLQVVHRDIKFENVLFDEERNQVVLADFGIAVSLLNKDFVLTLVEGSPAYMSPFMFLTFVENLKSLTSVASYDLRENDAHAALMVVLLVFTGKDFLLVTDLQSLFQHELQVSESFKAIFPSDTKASSQDYCSTMLELLSSSFSVGAEVVFEKVDTPPIKILNNVEVLSDALTNDEITLAYSRAKQFLGLHREDFLLYDEYEKVHETQGKMPPRKAATSLIFESGNRKRVYKINREISKGSYGEVWEAWELRSETHVALKFRAHSHVNLEEDLERRTLAAIGRSSSKHLNFCHEVIRFHDGELFVLEFVDGRPVDKFQYGPPQAQALGGQLFLAVAELHELNIAHRDLKPNNVLLDSEGRVVLVDFGEALLLQGEGPFPKPEIRGHPIYHSCLMCLRVNSLEGQGEDFKTGESLKQLYFSSDTHAAVLSLFNAVHHTKYGPVPRLSLLLRTEEISDSKWDAFRSALGHCIDDSKLFDSLPKHFLEREFFSMTDDEAFKALKGLHEVEHSSDFYRSLTADSSGNLRSQTIEHLVLGAMVNWILSKAEKERVDSLPEKGVIQEHALT